MPIKKKVGSAWFVVCGLRNKAAYTLIELLVVIAILGVAITSVLAFLTTSIKSSNQINVNAEVKQNAESVLAALEKQIRNADKVESVNSKQLKLTRQSGDYLFIKYFDDVLDLGSLGNVGSSNGYIGVYIGPSVPTQDTQYVSISNRDTTSGANIDECTFSISNNPGAPQTVSVSFNVSQAILAPSRQDYIANYKVQSTISLRRYN